MIAVRDSTPVTGIPKGNCHPEKRQCKRLGAEGTIDPAARRGEARKSRACRAGSLAIRYSGGPSLRLAGWRASTGRCQLATSSGSASPSAVMGHSVPSTGWRERPNGSAWSRRSDREAAPRKPNHRPPSLPLYCALSCIQFNTERCYVCIRAEIHLGHSP
jgi:hypothetical protein